MVHGPSVVRVAEVAASLGKAMAAVIPRTVFIPLGDIPHGEGVLQGNSSVLQVLVRRWDKD